MNRFCIAIAFLLAACGGTEGDDGSREVGDVWTRDGLVCARYEPHPQTHPGMAFTDCVPEGETFFCWRTDDEVDCNEGAAHIGCVALVDGDVARSGQQSQGCRQQHDCFDSAIDNPACCEEKPESVSAWDCPTS